MRAFLRSITYALAGITYVVRTQRNIRIELMIALAATLAGVFFRITAVEWALVILCIGMVLSAELINTVVELAVDLLSPQFHPLAKIAKDAGAGAVLVAALASVGVGVAIWGPRLWRLMWGG